MADQRGGHEVTTLTAIWSWVGQPEERRPKATRPGRYSRPLSIRDKTIAEAFGREVRRLRLLQGDMSTYALADLVGMSQPGIVKIETGEAPNVELRLMWDFAEALGAVPEHFLRVCEEAVKEALAKYRVVRQPIGCAGAMCSSLQRSKVQRGSA